jgi:hypothetical protein
VNGRPLDTLYVVCRNVAAVVSSAIARPASGA